MTQATTIMWFRQDLRLANNPALNAALEHGKVLPVYILDDTAAGEWRGGAASRWWLHQSLHALDASLGNRLQVYRGDTGEILTRLVAEHGAGRITWNRCYEPWRIARDQQLKEQLQQQDIHVESFNGSLLWEPWQILKQDDSPYKVFTAYYKQAIQHSHSVPQDSGTLDRRKLVKCDQDKNKVNALGLMPKINWYETMADTWQPGEQGAADILEEFLEQGLENYSEGRDFPAMNAVSRLSPHLHHGEIAPGYVLDRVMEAAVISGSESQGEHYRRELAWREFSHYLLYHLPHMTNANMNQRFDEFPWRSDDALLQAWQQGETGFPLVDAGMRELWQTGYMHNRVRMVVASFLTKNLMQHWLEGARWFWDCLVDADLANNSCSWQWVAGCGADAAPYFRIFNPVTQSQKFDPSGDYIRQYIPELACLNDSHIHEPWKAGDAVKLGKDYPEPIVDLKQSRERALQAYQSIKN